MSKIEFSLFKKATPETDFEESLGITRLNSFIFMLSDIIYILVAWLIQQNVWGGEQMGFVNLPKATYTQALIAVGVVTLISVAIQFFYLPKITSPAALLNKNQISSLNELGYRLNQAHLLRIAVAQVPAILGLVLYLLNGNIPHMIVFVLVSFITLLLIFPRQETWDEAKRLFRK